ncbi:MAG: hypothetical protein EP318_04720 [Rhodobacteraceae bacterium]|nr:MAG: hypothetical protein EP318_04720 [Paracoccaceae bacterium]
MSFLSNALPEKVKSRLPATAGKRLTPVLYAFGMVAIGAALLVTKPRIGQVPESRLSGDTPARSRLGRAAQRTRDATGTFAPTNVTDSIGRSLLIGGVALILTRVLDEALGSDR